MHRAESIMAAVLANITGLVTTSTRVARTRAYPVDGAALPALTLEQGSDVVELQNIRFIDRNLDFAVVLHAKGTGTIETTINTMREEVHTALMTTRTQGLTDYVIDTIALGDDAPELSGESNQPIMRLRMNWRIKYRHSITDPGA